MPSYENLIALYEADIICLIVMTWPTDPGHQNVHQLHVFIHRSLRIFKIPVWPQQFMTALFHRTIVVLLNQEIYWFDMQYLVIGKVQDHRSTVLSKRNPITMYSYLIRGILIFIWCENSPITTILSWENKFQRKTTDCFVKMQNKCYFSLLVH